MQPVYDIISLSFIWTPIGRDVHAIKMKDYSQNHHKTLMLETITQKNSVYGTIVIIKGQDGYQS